MAQKTKEQLKSTLIDGYLIHGSDFADIVDSLKAMQSPVGDPAASGNSVTFIATITQNAEGVITVTKKSVNFSGYQTTAGMVNYQNFDLQQVGKVTAGGGQSQNINHGMRHYPTVRLLDSNNREVQERMYSVVHTDTENLTITLDAGLVDRYKYVLD